MIFACVSTGTNYGPEWVRRLRDGVARHMQGFYRFICLTDHPDDMPGGVEALDVSGLGLPGWWAKLFLFSEDWRRGETVVYLDLDVVVTGSLVPLAGIKNPFAIAENFARLSGNHGWPCRFNSSVMTIAQGFDGQIYKEFLGARESLMRRNRVYGDQMAIEELCPDAAFLQPLLPPGFMLGYREMYRDHLTAKPPGCSVVVFGGIHKPGRPDVPQWVTDEWR